jgi:hypothetical protein
MVATLVSEASVSGRGGSTPPLPTQREALSSAMYSVLIQKSGSRLVGTPSANEEASRCYLKILERSPSPVDGATLLMWLRATSREFESPPLRVEV